MGRQDAETETLIPTGGGYFDDVTAYRTNAAGQIMPQGECTAAITTMTDPTSQFVAIPIQDKATRYKGGGDGRNDDGSANGFGIGQNGDPFPTLGAHDIHAVAFAQNQPGQLRTGDVANTLNTNSNASGRNTAMVQAAMQMGARFCIKSVKREVAAVREGTPGMSLRSLKPPLR